MRMYVQTNNVMKITTQLHKALEHLTLPCCDFAYGGLKNPLQRNKTLSLISQNKILFIQDTNHFGFGNICCL